MSKHTIAITIIGTCAFCSCGLVDLRPVVLTIEPREAYSVLPSRDAVLGVTFSAAPNHLDAERAFSVVSPEGSVDGDCIWVENKLEWKPLAAMDPGVRYSVHVRGEIRMLDGRRTNAEVLVPFFVVRSGGLPVLASFSPGNGASTGTAGDGAPALILTFSERMDEWTVQEAFSLRPSADFAIEWNLEGTVAAIVPEEALSPCSTYTWSLTEDARAVDGAPLPDSSTASFSTDIDAVPPRVERVFAVAVSDGEWVELSGDLLSLQRGHSLAILFSEAMEDVGTSSTIRVEPGVSGLVERSGQRLFVFTPERNWTPELPLELVVSTSARDSSGLAMAAEYRQSFTPASQFLRILRIETPDGESIDDVDAQGAFTVSVGLAPEGLLTLSLRFSEAFEASERVAAADAVSLDAFFPGDVLAPATRSVHWGTNDTLSITWELLRRSDAACVRYYQLRIAGGEYGIRSTSGAYL
ncbi:MAG: Ig-like domain-containing protein, partial [Spirochaetales bacterium]|nr:Ig-like domain-containing protein [Spirochaetales bacterium]